MRTLLVILPLLAACSENSDTAGGTAGKAETPKTPAPPKVPSFDTIDGTFATLVHAIRNKDIALLTLCFTDAANEAGESGVVRMAKDPDQFWAELQDVVEGPQSVESKDVDGDNASVRIRAPEAEGGGIGSMRFERVANGRWLIKSW